MYLYQNTQMDKAKQPKLAGPQCDATQPRGSNNGFLYQVPDHGYAQPKQVLVKLSNIASELLREDQTTPQKSVSQFSVNNFKYSTNNKNNASNVSQQQFSSSKKGETNAGKPETQSL